MAVAAVFLFGIMASVLFVNVGSSSEEHTAAELLVRNDAAKGRMDLYTLLLAAGVTDCVKPCVKGLVNASANTFTFNDLSHNFENICSEYRNASKCIEKNGCDEKDIYSIATKGLKSSCIDNHVLVQLVEPCLAIFADKVFEDCDAESGFIAALDEVVQNEKVQQLVAEGGNAMVLVKYLGNLCEALIKFLACTQKGLNLVCHGAGSAFVATCTAPFEFTAKEIASTTDSLVSLVSRQLPQQCRPFLDVDYMNTLKMFGALPVKKPEIKPL